MSEIRNFDIFFYNDLIVCPDCMKNFKVHKQTYRIKETFMYVLYEYDGIYEDTFVHEHPELFVFDGTYTVSE